MSASELPLLCRALAGASACLFLQCPAQWEQQWLTPWNAPTTGYETTNALATDSAGRYLVAGTARSTIPYSTRHGYVACFNADGTLHWNYLAEDQVGFYGGSSIFFDMAVSPDGNIAVVGTRQVPYNDYDGILVYLDSAGDTLWTRVMDSEVSDYDSYVLVRTLADTTILVAGYKFNGVWPDDHGLVIRKYDRQGQLLWERTDDLISTPTDMIVATWGNIWITGYSNADDRDIVIQRRDPEGYPTWEDTKDGMATYADDYSSRLAERPNGDVVVSGNLDMPGYTRDSWIAVYAINGDLRWEHQYGDAYEDKDGPMAVDPNGDIVFAVQREPEASYHTIELMKLDAEGAQSWSTIIAEANVGSEVYVKDMAFTSTGDIMLCGWMYDNTKGALWICDHTGAAFAMQVFDNQAGSNIFELMRTETDDCAIVVGTSNLGLNNASSEARLGKYCTAWLGEAPLHAAAQAMAFPQPFREGFGYSLPLPAGMSAHVSLYDVLGRSVWQGTCKATGHIEGVQHLRSGPYFLHWYTATGLGGTMRLTKE